MFPFAIGLLVILSIYVIRNYILPAVYLKPIEKETVNSNDYCTIDIRDYSLVNKNPIEESINIPLSILHRSVDVDDENCEKNIVVVSDDTKGALMAARILKKAKNKSVYFYTV